MFFLPFAEDIRRFSFAPLEPVVVTGVLYITKDLLNLHRPCFHI